MTTSDSTVESAPEDMPENGHEQPSMDVSQAATNELNENDHLPESSTALVTNVVPPTQVLLPAPIGSQSLAADYPLPIYGLALSPSGDYMPAPSAHYSLNTLLQNRQLSGIGIGFLALVLMGLSGWGFRWENGQAWMMPVNGITYMILGAVALGVAVWLLRPNPDAFSFTKQKITASRARWGITGLGALLLLVMAEANGRVIFKNFELSQHLQMLYFVGGALLVTYGLGGFKGVTLQAIFRRSSIPLFAITVLAFLIRMWNLAEAVHIMIDELHTYEGVIHLWDTPNLPLLSHLNGIATLPHIFSYIQQITVALFGPDFVGMRMTAVIFGALTVPATYLLARAIGDHKTGLLAAALMAVFAPEIHFSRLAILGIADPLFGALALAFLVNAFRHNSQRDYVQAGLMIGFSAYFYEAGRLLFFAVFFAWLIFMLVAHRPWAHRRGLIFMMITATLVMMPYYYYVFAQNAGLTPRLTDQGRLAYLVRDLREKPPLEVLKKHYDEAVQPAIFHTIYSPDSSAFYYGGYVGVLQWYQVIFFLLGLFYVLFRWRSIGVLLWLWMILGLVGDSLVVTADWTSRFNVFFPVMMVLVAIGLRYPLEMIWPERWNRRWLFPALAGIVVVISVVQLTFYFGEHLTFYNQQVRRSRDFYDVWDRATQVPNVTKIIYLTDDEVFTPVLDMSAVFRRTPMTYEIWQPKDGFEDKLSQLPRDGIYAFAIVPEDKASLAKVQAEFPLTLGHWSRFSSVPLDRQYALYLYNAPSDS
jgi:4-amino-4-deoxy-L-arabinose transferase-like glycosyltransferase